MMPKLINILFIAVIFAYFFTILSFISPARHVDPDFFQFLMDSEYYLRLELPPFIQSLPVNPILIGLFSHLLGNFFTEIEVALLINAVSVSGTILLFYYLVKREVGIVFAGLGEIFLITNPIVFASAVSNNTEVLFSFFLMLVVFLYWKKRLTLVVGLSALGILIRYESILLFVALFIVETLKKKRLSVLFKMLLTFTVLAFPILFILLNQNEGKSALETPFLVEFVARIEDIPEERFFTHFPFALFPYKNLLSGSQNSYYFLVGFSFWAAVYFLFKKYWSKNTTEPHEFSLLFTILFLIFHVFFPAYLERYFVPAIFSFTLSFFLISRKFEARYKSIFAIVIIFLIAVNSIKINISKKEMVFDSADYYTAEVIIKNTQKDISYILISPYPETIKYYYKDVNNIQLVSINNFMVENDCKSLECVFKNNSEKEIIIPYNSLFDWGMTGSYDHSLRKWYESISFYELGYFIHSENACMWHIEELPLKNTFVRLYKPCYK